MEELLDKIKRRVRDKDCPLSTVKSVAEALDLTESGFYRKIQSGKLNRLFYVNLANVLHVNIGYLTSEFTDENQVKIADADMPDSFGDSVFKKLVEELNLIKSELVEQIKTKDRQLEAKDRQLEAKDIQINTLFNMLGKYKGAIQIWPLRHQKRLC